MAYALASTATMGEAVLPGGIIRLRGYKDVVIGPGASDEAGRSPVFFETPWSLDHCRDMLVTAAYRVQAIREGRIELIPGPHCQWCPVARAGSPFPNCAERIGMGA